MNRLAPGLPAAALLLLPAAALAQMPGSYPPQESYSLRLEYREFRPEFTGEIQKGFGTEEGTLIDIVDDLGIEDDRTWVGTATLQIKQGHKLRGSYTPLDYRGDVAEAPRDFTYGQTEFERFAPVVTTMKGGYYSAAYEFDFVKGPRGFLGATLGAKMVDLDVTIVAPDTNERETDTWRSPVPVLGVITRVYVGRVSFESEVSGITLGDRGTLLEFDAGGRLHISDRLATSGGYRYLKIKGRDDRDFGDVTLEGWYFGLEISL